MDEAAAPPLCLLRCAFECRKPFQNLSMGCDLSTTPVEQSTRSTLTWPNSFANEHGFQSSWCVCLSQLEMRTGMPCCQPSWNRRTLFRFVESSSCSSRPSSSHRCDASSSSTVSGSLASSALVHSPLAPALNVLCFMLLVITSSSEPDSTLDSSNFPVPSGSDVAPAGSAFSFLSPGPTCPVVFTGSRRGTPIMEFGFLRFPRRPFALRSSSLVPLRKAFDEERLFVGPYAPFLRVRETISSS